MVHRVIPLIVVYGVPVVQPGGGSGGAPPPCDRLVELSLVAAALASAVLAEAVVKLIHALGGYTMLPLPTGASPLRQLPWHIRLTADGVLGVFGANFQSPPTRWALVFAVLHLVGVALVAWRCC